MRRVSSWRSLHAHREPLSISNSFRFLNYRTACDLFHYYGVPRHFFFSLKSLPGTLIEVSMITCYCRFRVRGFELVVCSVCKRSHGRAFNVGLAGAKVVHNFWQVKNGAAVWINILFLQLNLYLHSSFVWNTNVSCRPGLVKKIRSCQAIAMQRGMRNLRDCWDVCVCSKAASLYQDQKTWTMTEAT